MLLRMHDNRVGRPAGTSSSCDQLQNGSYVLAMRGVTTLARASSAYCRHGRFTERRFEARRHLPCARRDGCVCRLGGFGVDSRSMDQAFWSLHSTQGMHHVLTNAHRACQLAIHTCPRNNILITTDELNAVSYISSCTRTTTSANARNRTEQNPQT